MATRFYSLDPADKLEGILEGVGAANSSANLGINITIDLASTIMSDGSTTRIVKKSEILQAIDVFKEYITRSNWPPA